MRRFLAHIDYGLAYIHCRGSRQQKRVRVYQVVPPQDKREQVFQYWLARDEKSSGHPSQNEAAQLKLIDMKPKPKTESQSAVSPEPYVQLDMFNSI